jgi:hypothetical protein
MSHPNMKSRVPGLLTLMGDYVHYRPSPSAEPETRPAQEALRPTHSRVAENDDVDDGPRKRYQIQNPLWVIVIGMGFLFAAMALIVALG